MKEINSESLGSKRKTLAKEQVKRLFEKNHTRKQLDTIVYPPNKPYYCVSGLLMDYPLEKLFEWWFFNWVLIRHHIFGEPVHFWWFQMKEINSESLGSKRKTLAKEQVKRLFEKNHTRKQLDTIVYPQTNHTIVYQGCSWTTPLKNCLSDVS